MKVAKRVDLKSSHHRKKYLYVVVMLPRFIVFILQYIHEGNGNPLQYSCLENSVDREPGGLLSMGLHSRTRLKWLSMHACVQYIQIISLCDTPETNTTLYVNYVSVFFLGKKRFPLSLFPESSLRNTVVCRTKSRYHLSVAEKILPFSTSAYVAILCPSRYNDLLFHTCVHCVSPAWIAVLFPCLVSSHSLFSPNLSSLLTLLLSPFS